MDVQELIDNRALQLVVVGGVTFTAGFALGYYVNRDRSVYIPAEPVEEPTPVDENALMFDFDTEVVHQHTITTIEVIEEEPTQTLRLLRDSLAKQEDEVDEDKELAEVTNIFANTGDWDYAEELKKREKFPDKPYIIHQDEFMAEETDYKQSTCMYYAGDDILVDDHDVPIARHKDVVGELIFGHGATSEDLVYVRNDKLQGEYEIIRLPGFYAIEVLGYDRESEIDEEDEKPNLRKFRSEE